MRNLSFRFPLTLATALLAWGLTFSAVDAAIVVVDFDDLSPTPGSGTLADGYGGIQWHGQWDYSDLAPGYDLGSPPVYVFDNSLTGNGEFSFSAPVEFFGASFSGISPVVTNFDPLELTTVLLQFELYLQGALVHVAPSFTPDLTAAFYAAGYSGPVDEVRIRSNVATSYAMDNVTYGPVPEPVSLATWSALGLGAFVARGLRRRQIV